MKITRVYCLCGRIQTILNLSGRCVRCQMAFRSRQNLLKEDAIDKILEIMEEEREKRQRARLIQIVDFKHSSSS